MKTKKCIFKKKKPSSKQLRESRLDLVKVVRSLFDEAPDPIFLGEIRLALITTERREEARTRIIRSLFRGPYARNLARSMVKQKPVWMSDLSHLRLRRAMKKFTQMKGG